MGLTVDLRASTIRRMDELSPAVELEQAGSTADASSDRNYRTPRRRAMPARGWLLVGLLLVPYIFISSVLGLAILTSLDFDRFVGIWSASAAADAAFVVGSIAAGVAAVIVANRFTWGSIALAGALTWVTYTVAAILEAPGAELWSAMSVVLQFGVFGLIFGAVAPAAARVWLVRLLTNDRPPRRD
jgi:hypothetical protein